MANPVETVCCCFSCIVNCLGVGFYLLVLVLELIFLRWELGRMKGEVFMDYSGRVGVFG